MCLYGPQAALASYPDIRLNPISDNKKAYLDMSADLLLAREALLSVPRTVIPETLVMRFPSADMRRRNMFRQRIDRRIHLRTVLPMAPVRPRRTFVAFCLVIHLETDSGKGR